MKLSFTAIAALSLGILATGCVSQKKYKQLQANYNSLQKSSQSQNGELSAKNQDCMGQLSAAKSRVSSLEEQLASEKANLSSLQAALDKCLTSAGQGNVNISKLVDEINASNKYIQPL